MLAWLHAGNDINPKNDIERVYCTIVLVIGACFYAIIVSACCLGRALSMLHELFKAL